MVAANIEKTPWRFDSRSNNDSTEINNMHPVNKMRKNESRFDKMSEPLTNKSDGTGREPKLNGFVGPTSGPSSKWTQELSAWQLYE